MRGYDLLSAADRDIKDTAQPRYYLEMLLLRWIHLRKLVPIEDVIAGLDRGAPALPRPGGGGTGGSGTAVRPSLAPARPAFRPDPTRKSSGPQSTVSRIQQIRAGPGPAAAGAAGPAPALPDVADQRGPVLPELAADVGDRLVAELKRVKAAFFGMVIAQAQTVECDGRRVIFTFGPEHEHLRNQVEARRAEIEKIAEQLSGRRVPIATMRGVAP